MKQNSPRTSLKLAAIDLDGTLLGPDHRISPANQKAVEKLVESGVQVVLASGRHYGSIRPLAESLPSVQWIISGHGGELASRDRSEIIFRHFIDPREMKEILGMQARYGVSSIYYTADGTVTHMDTDSHIQFFLDLEPLFPERVTPEQILAKEIIKAVWIGEPPKINQILSDFRSAPRDSQIVQTFDNMCEFMPHITNKGDALDRLSKNINIPPTSTVVFGDGENDIPMFQWAGTSYAMPHGWPKALKAATHTVPSPSKENALAHAIEDCLTRYSNQ